MHYSLNLLIRLPLLLIFLNACQLESNKSEDAAQTNPPLNNTVAIAFAPDNRLWRLTPGSSNVYLDFSDDYGVHYSQPVKINPAPQKISAWPENPPAIAIAGSGRINVLYYADAEQKSTSYFTYSDDLGQTFSPPQLISEHAAHAMHYMDKMLIDQADKLHLFWHDRRHKQDISTYGAGLLSLYYSVIEPEQPQQHSNQFISDRICSCCRTAAAFDSENNPVILARTVFETNIRDHSLIRMNTDQQWSLPGRVTHDNWQIDACPEHGPALAIDRANRSHMTWFTLGNIRQGIFYAYSDDFGRSVSPPLQLGNSTRLPSNPDVITLGDRVALVWKEFDGDTTYIQLQDSFDRGQTWSVARTVFSTASENGHPVLIKNQQDIFLSWVSRQYKHKLIKL